MVNADSGVTKKQEPREFLQLIAAGYRTRNSTPRWHRTLQPYSKHDPE
jgi:hypothetical protein